MSSIDNMHLYQTIQNHFVLNIILTGTKKTSHSQIAVHDEFPPGLHTRGNDTQQ